MFEDIMKNENVKLNWLFAYSLIKDLTEVGFIAHFDC